MRSLDPKQILLDDVITSPTSSKSVNRNRDTGYDVASPSDRPYIISSPSYSKSGTAGPSEEDIYAISLSSEDSFGKSKKKRTTKHEKRQRSRSSLKPSKYLFTLDMDKDFLTVLRRKVFRIIKNLPDDSQLSIQDMFKSQRNLVNGTLILTIQASIDQSTYPVDDNVIYDIIYERHKHCRESYLLELRSSRKQDEQARRRHKNARARETHKFLRDYIDRTFNESSMAIWSQKYDYCKSWYPEIQLCKNRQSPEDSGEEEKDEEDKDKEDKDEEEKDEEESNENNENNENNNDNNNNGQKA
ncbi:hypothetical protein C1646_767036 [Rhizophagus diaphanus]|nr:hypothetical protein C1646_767036 [Rhizophagus diaphanus] [Rhizophagus sp. MUCL 43196]